MKVAHRLVGLTVLAGFPLASVPLPAQTLAGTTIRDAPADAAPARSGRITVTREVTGRTPTSVATGLEDVNHEIYGGIYSQMVFGEAFAEPEREAGISGMWRSTGIGASYALTAAEPFKGRQSQSISRKTAGAWSGIENRGLNRQGLSLLRGKAYEGRIALRSYADLPIRVSFQSADGRAVYASQIIRPGRAWSIHTFALTPTQSDGHARFAVETASAGSADVGYALVQPGPWGRYKGLPVRADVANAMVQQGLQAIRFGGCANSGCGDVPDYKWKAMVGNPAMRPVTRGFWYPHESNGFGIFEFLQLGEAMGIEAVPSLNIDETPEDVRDLMDYLYGSAQTKWGAQRIADGHPAPYRVRRFQLGNENSVDDAYFAKFKALAEAVWSHDPGIRLVVGDFNYVDVIRDPFDFTGGTKIRTLAAHQRILQLAAKWKAEVDFDVHIWTRQFSDGGWEHKGGSVATQVAALDSYAAALRSIAPPDARFKVVVFELNANTHDHSRALANAYAITALQKRPYLDVVSSANALQVNGQNDNGWNQGLIFMDQAKVWMQPPYYVHQMVARSMRAQVLRAKVSGGNEATEVTALGDDGGTSLNIVNASNEAVAYDIDFGVASGGAQVTVTSLGPDRGSAVNTSGNPVNIVPETSSLRLDGQGRTSYRIPPRTFLTMTYGRR